MLQEQVQQAVISNYRHCTVPMAGTLIGTLKAKVPSRDMGLTTDIHPCAQIVSEWLSAMSHIAYMLAKRASAGEVAYFGACHF